MALPQWPCRSHTTEFDLAFRALHTLATGLFCMFLCCALDLCAANVSAGSPAGLLSRHLQGPCNLRPPDSTDIANRSSSGRQSRWQDWRRHVFDSRNSGAVSNNGRKPPRSLRLRYCTRRLCSVRGWPTGSHDLGEDTVQRSASCRYFRAAALLPSIIVIFSSSVQDAARSLR